MSRDTPPPDGLRRSLTRVGRRMKEKFGPTTSRSQSRTRDPALAALEYTFANSTFDLPAPPPILCPLAKGLTNAIPIRFEAPLACRPSENLRSPPEVILSKSDSLQPVVLPEVLDFRNVTSTTPELVPDEDREPTPNIAALRSAPIVNIDSPHSPPLVTFPSINPSNIFEIDDTKLQRPNSSQGKRSGKSSLISSLYPPSTFHSTDPQESITSAEMIIAPTTSNTMAVHHCYHPRAGSAPVDHTRNISSAALSLDIPSVMSSYFQMRPSSASSAGQRSTKILKDSAWTVLEGTLRTLEKCSEGVPPLKSAVGMLVSCIDNVQEANRNRKEYQELASDLVTVTSRLANHLEETKSTKISSCVMSLVKSLQDQTEHVMAKQNRSTANRYAEADDDREDLVECYRRIEMLFRRLESDAVLSVWSITNEQLANARLDGVAPAKQARYNSSASLEVRRRRCTSNTRRSILEQLRAWAHDSSGQKIYWMNGMAGTGKTTIAYSFCEELERTSHLGASFFCCRDLPECRDVSRLIPTIAYQLARASLPFQSALCRIIGESPDISSQAIPLQFEKLIRDPFIETKDTWPSDLVVVIDALDECASQEGAQLILDTLIRHVEHLPVKFFITGRPEPSVQSRLSSQTDYTGSVLHLHDIEESLVQGDIETYLTEELASFSPSPDRLKLLAKRAKNLFIYAATAVRYIQPSGMIVNPHQRLDIMLGMRLHPGNRRHDELDVLYTTILSAALENKSLDQREAETTKRILHTVVCAREPMSTTTLAGFLDLAGEEDIVISIQPLQSVLYVSGGSPYSVSAFHTSFPDYMLSRERSGRFFCDLEKHSEAMARRCFETMSEMLRFNICELESSYVLDEDVPDLQERIKSRISPRLLYACRYWSDHLEHVRPSPEMLDLVDGFLSRHVLFWMEVLNLTNSVAVGGKMLLQAHLWLESAQCADRFQGLLLDARKFVVTFGANSVSRSTPHIYISALSFWPKTGPMWKIYGRMTRKLAHIHGTAMDRRDTSNVAVWNLSSRVTSMAISPDNTCIASGSEDCLIRIWDLHSGRLLLKPLAGHHGWVVSLAFSADGARIVSGSNDHSIRIWDAQTGLSLGGPFISGNSCITSVVFSFGSASVIAGSLDNTISVWDTRSGRLAKDSLIGHTDSVQSVAISPDGKLVASGSDDCSVCVWDFQSRGIMAGPFRSHNRPVNSVAFSPDNVLLASGSDDCSICVWDVLNNHGIPLMSFKGHTEPIRSVAFSPDGAFIASGSHDRTVRVWSIKTRSLASGPFKRHTDTVTSVSFTPDGTCVISSSFDKTIRVWDAHSGQRASTLLDGHSGEVCAVAISPDSSRLISSSHDSTARFWDAETGVAVAAPYQKQGAWATCAAFSPNSTHVALGFQDHSVCVLDARTGQSMASPFREHDSWVASVAFSPDGSAVASSCANGIILVWGIRSRKLSTKPLSRTPAALIRSIAFSPDGKRLASGSEDGVICLWDIQRGRRIDLPFQGHTGSVRAVAFSPSAACIASGSDDCTVRIWDANDGKNLVDPLQGHEAPVNAVVFSPAGALVLSASRDHTIRIWDTLNGGSAVRVLRAHTGSINCISVSLDGGRMVTGSSDRVIRVWDVNSLLAKPIDTLRDWDINEEGWVVDRDGQLLLWVPNDLRAGLLHPPNSAVIHRRGSVELNFDEALLGERWSQCFMS